MDLGKRLAKVASLVLPADTMADVGCDHGYLSVYLIEQKRCSRMIAMDVNKGPLQKARENIGKYGYGDYIETRLSDGLQQLRSGETDGYICAGMGGPLALQILWNDRDKVSRMQQIILQPQSELWLVRRTLRQWGFVIEKEDVEYEDGKYYFMMRIRPGEHLSIDSMPGEEVTLFDREDAELSEHQLQKYAYELYAEELLNNRNEVLYEYINREIQRLTEIYNSLIKQEESEKCAKRVRMVQKELAVQNLALKQYKD